MINIYMIRHGCVDSEPMLDPALNNEGRQQAIRSAKACMAMTHAIPILASPLLRCQQSAEILAEAWGVDFQLELRVTEVPSPMSDPTARSRWLHGLLGQTWSQMRAQGELLKHGYTTQLMQWQHNLQQVVQDCQQDVVIYSHFFVINALLSLATGQQQVAASLPDYGAIFHFQYSESGLLLVSKGAEMPSVLV